jgi:hypothetical protein
LEEEDDDEEEIRMHSKGGGRKGRGRRERRTTEGPSKRLRDGKEKGMDDTIVYGRMDKERKEGIGGGGM